MSNSVFHPSILLYFGLLHPDVHIQAISSSPLVTKTIDHIEGKSFYRPSFLENQENELCAVVSR